MKKRHISIVTVVIFLLAFSFQNALAEGWEQSYHAGTFDENGNFMGGTETMSLVAHKGKLYAGTSMWMNPFWKDRQFPFTISAQILVKESAYDTWKLDYQTDKQILRVDHLASITLSTDDKGTMLSPPVNLLVAGLCGIEAATVAVHDDEKDTWVTTSLPSVANEATSATTIPIVTTRAIVTHRDTVTGFDHVFAGVYPGIILRGVYDAAVQGRIRWDKTPELSIFTDRIMAFAECNGELYAAIKPAIYKRVDGRNPKWIKVYEYTTYEGDKPSLEGGSSGMRGLTAIPNPNGEGEVLLMALEGYETKIVYLDPSDNNSVTTDLDLDAFYQEQWGADWELCKKNGWDYNLAAYNDMVPVTDSKTGETLLLIGLMVVYHPSKPDSTWYLVRRPDATYTLHEIPYFFDLRGWPKKLQGTRAIRVSPFAEDQEHVLYFGGFDCIGKNSHNTAWIYKTDINTALGITE